MSRLTLRLHEARRATPRAGADAPQRFSAEERRRLLAMPGIGETVVNRLEAAGYVSLRALREAGAQTVTERVWQQLGASAWRNRQRAIARAIFDTMPEHGVNP